MICLIKLRNVVVIVGQPTRRPNSESNGKSVADFFKEHNKYLSTDTYFFGGLCTTLFIHGR